MSSGRINMKFSAEISQANAQIGKLNAQLRKQQKELAAMRDRSKESSRAQDSAIVNLTRNISGAAIAYRTVNEAIAVGNQLLRERLDLQRENLEPAARIGEAAGRFFMQLGGGVSDAQAADISAFIKRQAIEAKVDPRKAYDFAGAVVTSLGGEASIDTAEKLLQRTKEVMEAGLPLARQFEGTQVGVLVGGLTTMGFTAEEAVANMIQLQKAVHSVDLASQSYIMRSLVAGKIFNLEGFQEMTPERQKKFMQEMMAITAGFTQEMKARGMEMPSTAGAGAMLTMYEKYGDMLVGKSPFEVLEWMQRTGVWQELELKDIRGESIGKPATQQLFSGKGKMWDTVQKIYSDLSNATIEDAAKVIERTTEGVVGSREAFVFSAEEGRKAEEGIYRAKIGGMEAMIDEDIKSFEYLFQGRMSGISRMLTEGDRLWGGVIGSPDELRLRALTAARRQAFTQRYGMLTGLGPGVTLPLEQLDFGTVNSILRQYREGREMSIEGELTPDQVTDLKGILEQIDMVEKFRQEQSGASSPSQPVNSKSSDRKQTDVLKKTVEQSGATKQRGRHTEPD